MPKGGLKLSIQAPGVMFLRICRCSLTSTGKILKQFNGIYGKFYLMDTHLLRYHYERYATSCYGIVPRIIVSVKVFFIKLAWHIIKQ